jgi:hypothetical protein
MQTMKKNKVLGLAVGFVFAVQGLFGTASYGMMGCAKKEPNRITIQVPVKATPKAAAVASVKKEEPKKVKASFAFKVPKGATLWGIARNLLGSPLKWKEIQEINPEIKDPARDLKTGMEIRIPGTRKPIKKVSAIRKSNEPKEYKDSDIGRDPYRGSIEKALVLLRFSDEVSDLLQKEIEAGNFTEDFIRSGDLFLMTSGKDKIAEYVAKLKNPLEVKKYQVAYNGLLHVLLYISECGNWVRPPERQITPKKEPPPVEEEKPPEIEKPPVEEVKPPEVSAPPEEIIISEIPIVPQIPEPFKFPRYKKIQCRDFELNAAGGYLHGNLNSMNDFWAYAEGIAWDSCWYWSKGAGFYGKTDKGEVESGYGWKDWGIGPQIALRYQNYALDEGVMRPYGITGKLRLMYNRMEGNNPLSGYGKTEEQILLGLYLEYVRQLKQGLMAGVTFEAWIQLWGNLIQSTWSGDKVSDQGRLEIGGFIQKRISDDFQVRARLSLFHQMSDDMNGAGASVEIRYHEWIMCGAYVGWYWENGGLVYGPYCRAEVGNLIREQRDKKIVAEIWAVDEDGSPIGDGIFQGGGATNKEKTASSWADEDSLSEK